MPEPVSTIRSAVIEEPPMASKETLHGNLLSLVLASFVSANSADIFAGNLPHCKRHLCFYTP